MINIINKLSLLFFNRNNKTRKNIIHNKNYHNLKINKQKLYEKWCKKEKWLLYNEGILLLLSIDPSEKHTLNEELIIRINDLKNHANECVKKNLLSVIDINKPENSWEVKPIDLYRWAKISRIPIPDEFNSLMIFITQTIKVSNRDNNLKDHENSQDKLNQSEKEIILGAATSLLINSPEICRDNNGNIDCKVIASKIIKNKKYWFGECKSNIPEHRIVNILEKYARISKAVY
tara:strand:+ start:290 stop:988 length:699 start_codon:yes stop_codon:yes gene_type:complete